MSFDFRETFTVPLPNLESDIANFAESEYSAEHGLVIEIAAIHEGVTSNYTEYSAAELSNGLHTWYTPYQKPIILNHDQLSESIGRVIGAKMDAEEDGTAYAKLQAAIVDPIGIQKVRDRRYLTGSIGGKSNEAVCTVCDTDWANPKEAGRAPCPHKRGQVYKGKLATLAMKDITFVEYSFVNVPADKLSGVRGIATSESDGWNNPARFFVLDLGKESIVECVEGVEGGHDILGEMKKKDASPLYHEFKGAFIQAQISKDNELEESVNTYIGDTNKNSDSIETSSEETTSMEDEETVDTAEQEEDILSITEGLSEDLNAPATDNVEESSDDSADTTEQTDADDTVTDTTESDDQTSTEEADQAQSNDTDEAAPSDDATDTAADDTENVAEGDEASKTDDAEQTTEADLTTPVDESVVEEFESRIRVLEEQNEKLKKALHRTLAERVVDAKIAVGLVEADTRAESITEHAARTASSLADSLRDLAAQPKTVAPDVTRPTEQVNDQSASVDGEDNVLILGEDEEKSIDKAQVLEDAIFETLMGRKAL
jgi:hypothetical protein